MDLQALNDNAIRVTLYLVAAGSCLVAGLVERRRSHPNGTAITWFLLATVVLVLGFGREIELGHMITARGRSWAKAQGWYPDRRPLQRQADVLVVFGGSIALLVISAVFGRRARRQLPAFCALVLLAMFIAIRAISYHEVDQLLYNHPWHGLRLNTALEIMLTLGMASSALWAVMRLPVGRLESPDPEQLSGHA